ncbi:MAG: hypothetical protein ACPHL6_06005 [Rubripirellula sp.]
MKGDNRVALVTTKIFWLSEKTALAKEVFSLHTGKNGSENKWTAMGSLIKNRVKTRKIGGFNASIMTPDTRFIVGTAWISELSR